MMNGRRTFLISIGAALTACTMLLAATPPSLLNYQGVLRDSSDAPLDGSYHMIFRLWSAETGGDEILIDESLAGDQGLIKKHLFYLAVGFLDSCDRIVGLICFLNHFDWHGSGPTLMIN